MAEAKAGMSRLWRVVLVISLALNMAVAGIVAGFAWRVRDDGPPERFDFSLGPVGAALSHDDRRAIGRMLRNDRDLRAMRRGDMSRESSALIALLRSTPLDEAALRQLAEAPNVRAVALQAAAARAFVVRVTQMTESERLAFADRLERMEAEGRQKRN